MPWKAGRADFAEGEGVTPDGRLPDAAQGGEHLRDIFYRMGFDDREIVALSGVSNKRSSSFFIFFMYIFWGKKKKDERKSARARESERTLC